VSWRSSFTRSPAQKFTGFDLGCLGFFVWDAPDLGAAHSKIVPDYL